MQRPDKILIPPFVVEIGELSAVEGDKSYGAYYLETQQIKLRPSFATKQLHAETLFHETLHAAWDIADLSPKDGEEKIVAALSKQLCAIIQSNPGLIEWLTENLAVSHGSTTSDTTTLKPSKRTAGKQRKR